MKLIIMRHGEAQMSAPSDAERSLSEKGRAQVMRTAKMIKSKYQVTSIFASPYLRAQQTGELLAGELECSINVMEELVPNGDARAVIDLLDPSYGCVLLASHMPLVSELTGLMCEGVIDRGPLFSTGSAAMVEFDVREIGAGLLVEMIA